MRYYGGCRRCSPFVGQGNREVTAVWLEMVRRTNPVQRRKSSGRTSFRNPCCPLIWRCCRRPSISSRRLDRLCLAKDRRNARVGHIRSRSSRYCRLWIMVGLESANRAEKLLRLAPSRIREGTARCHCGVFDGRFRGAAWRGRGALGRTDFRVQGQRKRRRQKPLKGRQLFEQALLNALALCVR